MCKAVIKANVFIIFYLTRQVRENQILIYNGGLARPKPDPDDAGPIVRHPMGLPIMADCDTDWNKTRVCSDTSSTEMQKTKITKVRV